MLVLLNFLNQLDVTAYRNVNLLKILVLIFGSNREEMIHALG